MTLRPFPSCLSRRPRRPTYPAHNERGERRRPGSATLCVGDTELSDAADDDLCTAGPPAHIADRSLSGCFGDGQRAGGREVADRDRMSSAGEASAVTPEMTGMAEIAVGASPDRKGTRPVRDDSDAVVVGGDGLDAGSALMSVVSAAHEQLVILTVRGSIDVLTAPRLSEAVAEALDGQPRGLIIDLTLTEFLASAGMTALITAHEAIAPAGLFGVVAAGPVTARPLQVMGLDQTLMLYPTLAHAVAAMTAPPEPEGMTDRQSG